MNARHTARHPLLLAALVVCLPLALAGCGNKGPLVMSEEPAEIEAPPTPEGGVPVEIAIPQALPAEAPVAPATGDPATTDDFDDAAPPEPLIDDPRIPIDPATVPQNDSDNDTDSDNPPATGTVDDGNG
ncbi:LPS translocon maturation chaperone LptM [Novilysobacter erysipheiresistens]|uniref:Lipoprotein n=1 Tax=Novilysobacter erysipheiresistens TaxID=1749332 RepID=A0ABU7YZG4_9GAMM